MKRYICRRGVVESCTDGLKGRVVKSVTPGIMTHHSSRGRPRRPSFRCGIVSKAGSRGRLAARTLDADLTLGDNSARGLVWLDDGAPFRLKLWRASHREMPSQAPSLPPGFWARGRRACREVSNRQTHYFAHCL